MAVQNKGVWRSSMGLHSISKGFRLSSHFEHRLERGSDAKRRLLGASKLMVWRSSMGLYNLSKGFTLIQHVEFRLDNVEQALNSQSQA